MVAPSSSATASTLRLFAAAVVLRAGFLAFGEWMVRLSSL
jgi:hypothetical protein